MIEVGSTVALKQPTTNSWKASVLRNLSAIRLAGYGLLLLLTVFFVWYVGKLLFTVLFIGLVASLVGATYFLLKRDSAVLFADSYRAEQSEPLGKNRPWLVRLREHHWRPIRTPAGVLPRPVAYLLVFLGWWWLLS